MRRPLPVLAALVVVAGAGLFTLRLHARHAAQASGCDEGIGVAATNALFAQLKTIAPAEGCALSAVDTEHDRIRVRYTHGETTLTDLVLTGKTCASAGATAGKAFAYRVPADLKATCPATVDAFTALLATEDFGGTIAIPRPGP